MIKFTLKRKITGAKLKELKKIAKRSEEVITDNPVWGKTISYKPIPYRRDYSMDHNKPIGKKYPPALYDLQPRVRHKLKRYGKQESIGFHSTDWNALRLIEDAKKKGKKGRVEKLYKIYPNLSPQYKLQKEHEEKVRKWQAKLKANELIQNQNRRK